MTPFISRMLTRRPTLVTATTGIERLGLGAFIAELVLVRESGNSTHVVAAAHPIVTALTLNIRPLHSVAGLRKLLEIKICSRFCRRRGYAIIGAFWTPKRKPWSSFDKLLMSYRVRKAKRSACSLQGSNLRHLPSHFL